MACPTMDMQSQIRHNAEEVSSYLRDMSKWEKNINSKILRKKMTSSDARNQSMRLGSGTVKIMDRSSGKKIEAPLHSNDPHLASELTPATLVKGFVLPSTVPAVVPAARGIPTLKDAEAAERERGNEEFRMGNFTAAIKSYTKCLGLKSKNCVAFSNRAMAYIRIKEFLSAESDCSNALSIDALHVKSFIRRATSRNALGKHRAALLDLSVALELEPNNKHVRGEIQRTNELLRSAINRAPLVVIHTQWRDDSSYETNTGPDLSDDT